MLQLCVNKSDFIVSSKILLLSLILIYNIQIQGGGYERDRM